MEAPADIEPLPCGDDEKGASDDDLFKEPPPRDECPICFLAQPSDEGETAYFSCCGKVICRGCVHAAHKADDRNLCPFCRTPASTSQKEYIKGLKKRMDGGDANAMYNLGCYYYHGTYGLRRNHNKAMKLYLRAGELGYTDAYNGLGNSYYNGRGVERDAEKAKHYWELAAIGGDIIARHNLGVWEENAGNTSRAMKHWMISTAAGWDDSLKEIREVFLNGNATKDDFEKALRAHQASKDEMKSEQREAAARFYGLN